VGIIYNPSEHVEPQVISRLISVDAVCVVVTVVVTVGNLSHRASVNLTVL
jgi:hypothetical protein